ncbi:MAG: hypothetical protein IKP07_05155 [Bacilli bacterium]|nr:hypothetical protein [Bacilli bacterium]
MGEVSDYKIDYNDSADGVNTINKTSQGINDIIEQTNKNMNDTFDKDVFSGPLADYCQGNWEEIKRLAMKNSNNIAESGRVLNAMTESYKDSDDRVGESVGNS